MNLEVGPGASVPVASGKSLLYLLKDKVIYPGGVVHDPKWADVITRSRIANWKQTTLNSDFKIKVAQILL